MSNKGFLNLNRCKSGQTIKQPIKQKSQNDRNKPQKSRKANT
jgi:hypothetical protein